MSQSPDTLPDPLHRWLELPSVSAQRRFLEAHPALVSLESEALLAAWMGQTPERSPMAPLSALLDLLRDARQRGGTLPAIREASLNRFGGWALDLPPWLEEVERQLATLQQAGHPRQTAAARVHLLQAALTEAQDSPLLPTEVGATLQQQWIAALLDLPPGERQQDLVQARSVGEAVLGVYPSTRAPYQYAQMHHLLGLALLYYYAEDQRASVEVGLAHLREALTFRPLERYPSEYAETQHHLGWAYRQRLAGDQRENLEQAIACFQEALRVRTLDAFPAEYAQTQTQLGAAYWRRIAGDRRENLEQAIACSSEALRVRTEAETPFEYASSQVSQGVNYYNRIAGNRRENLEQAIACYQAARRVWTREAHPFEYAFIQNNLGCAYRVRLAGNRQENLEQALACLGEAVQIWTRDTFPHYYAAAQEERGLAFHQQLSGNRQANLEQAVACFQEVLEVWTLERNPVDHRQNRLNLAETEIALGRWEAAQVAYAQAEVAEALLVALGAGERGRSAVLSAGRDAASRAAYVLLRLGRLEEALLTLERGRARGLAASLALDAADPAQIGDPARQGRYRAAREALIVTQTALNAPLPEGLGEDEQRRRELARIAAYRQAHATFEEIVDEVRQAHDPAGFLEERLEGAHVLAAAACGGPGHALVYLAATPWGGLALAALPASPTVPTARFAALDLPQLTDTLTSELLSVLLEESPDLVLGGLAHALEGRALALLACWPGGSELERATALHGACQTTGTVSRLDQAVQQVLSHPDLHALWHAPLAHLTERERALLDGTLLHAFLQRELAHCQAPLAQMVLDPLADWLEQAGVSSLTLIPCGTLAALPLPTIPLADGRTLSDRFPTSLAPSARALLRETTSPRGRAGLYALGDTRPRDQPLPWAEAEALTVTSLAARLGWSASARVKGQATRAWLLHSLEQGQVVNAACHGVFDQQDVLRSRLLLARGDTLTLADLLSRVADLRGLRLLLLSGCQTALLDVRGARDEVQSLAAGMLQAGAQAVLGVLWPVEDEAAYLLTVRFAQEWLPRRETEPPAAALARAQHWLRTVTNRALRTWQAEALPTTGRASGRGAGPLSRRGALRRVRGRGLRLELKEAERRLRDQASGIDLDTCPFADPIHWAGFHLIGW